ncbi:hydroxyisourate hydrolase [Psychroflexus halocasei]|uniref:5-hydroxyisourate hydrolase n=1 Tax=Psychroflexus halocasei TaxID=908615 RepID=A0A1H4CIU5_9FLAO|nr:hydroxyisourate hydrolase [Psychroflexus halocasei]SEA60249.1 5-hydroxyisourate hydrolase [Psychroflexus halocasei]
MKTILFSLVFSFISLTSFAQQKEGQLSTHILDISTGQPAPNVEVQLEKYNAQNDTWHLVATKKTLTSGRINDFLSQQQDNLGIYKLRFKTKAYFKSNDINSFYPYIEVVFEIENQKHYHVPITLSAYGYSTYRGS